MPHLNVKPIERSRVYVTGEQAINHIFLYGVFSKHWDYSGKPFGQTISERRAIDAAIKARNFPAFKACQRRGFWRVELV